MRMWRLPLLVLLSRTALAAAPADAWLDGLQERVAADLRAGKPLVVQAHVALCDNHIIECGNARLGDGDDLERNLYWATTGGLRGWFERRGSGWRLAARHRGARTEILEELVFTRRVTPTEAWRARGVVAPFDVYVVAEAWSGMKIDAALDAYVGDLFGDEARVVDVGAAGKLAAGGAAQVVAYVGHNRWMDREAFDWPAIARRHGAGHRPKGTMAVACASADYLAREISAPARVPLLMTADLLFAGSMSLEGAVRAFADGESYAAIRVAAARAYADEEKKPFARVQSLFINPGDRRWPR